MNPVEVSPLFDTPYSENMLLLDVSHRTDEPANIIRDLRVELAKIAQSENRHADVTMRVQSGLLPLLRLLRWNCIFDLHEATGLPAPRDIQYHWKRSVPGRYPKTFRDQEI